MGKRGSFLLFTSLEFLLTFLPGTLLVYFLIPRKVRNYWLLLVRWRRHRIRFMARWQMQT